MTKLTILFTAVLLSSSFSDASTTLVCKKRSKQSYSAFYRTELTTAEDGSTKFEYGVGDSSRIFELYYFTPVQPAGPDVWESREGELPKLRVEIQAKRRKRELSFSLTGTDGKGPKRDGYICESESAY